MVGLQLAIEEAEFLMNTVAAGECSWDSIRSELANRYEEGNQRIIADFIRAAAWFSPNLVNLWNLEWALPLHCILVY